MYDLLAESTLDGILASMEDVAERREDTDVEYSVCVSILLPQLAIGLTNLYIFYNSGWRPNYNHPGRNLRNKQTTSQPSDLALVPSFRSETVRLGPQSYGVGIDEGWGHAKRIAEERDWDYV